MSEMLAKYRCNICGNIVEVLHAGNGELVCCGEAMKMLEPKTQEAEGKEKHIPVIVHAENQVKVKVGSVPHPMEEKHHIEWIEINVDGKICRKYLQPGNPAEAVFNETSDNIIAREYCNIHGYWTT
jgi:superoxide reductase